MLSYGNNMPKLKLWTIYTLDQSVVHVIKGKKAAERLTLLMNKIYKRLNTHVKVQCDSLDSFYSTHAYSPDSIHFTWDATDHEKRHFQYYIFSLQRHVT